MSINENLGHSNKCPACGGNLIFDAQEQVLTCSFCGGTFSPEKLELLSQIVSLDQEAADENEDDKHEIVCNSCGANIIADNNTSATFCAFCGSPSLVTQRLTKQFRPDYVIPFKITREQALEKIKEFAKNGKYAPHHFFNDNNIKKITGIYVPFWLMDAECKMHTHGVGYREDLKSSDKYTVVSDIDIGVKNVPFDGAINMKDDLMESIEPYDCSELKPFNASYLQGFYAQRYDLSVDKLSDRIIYRLQRYGKEAATTSLKGYERFHCDSCTVKPEGLEQKYALFPVWLLTYEYGGINYQIAVNAQTGKTDGHLPVDKVKKYARLAWYHFTNLMIFSPLWGGLLALIIWAQWWARNNPDMAAAVNIILALSCAFALPAVVVAITTIRAQEDDDFGRYNLLNPVIRAFKSFVRKRINLKSEILAQTDMMVGAKPAFDEYYDPEFKTQISHEEIFMCHESIFDAQRS